jgi:hypothetical protein
MTVTVVACKGNIASDKMRRAAFGLSWMRRAAASGVGFNYGMISKITPLFLLPPRLVVP